MAHRPPRQPLPPRPRTSSGPPAAQRRSPAPRRQRRQTKRRVVRVLGALVLILLAAVSLYGGYAYRSSAALRKYLPALFAHGLHQKTPADVFPNQPAINLLVIGRDYDYTDKDQVIKSHARSDVLMVARVDFARKAVGLLSIPRDTRVRIPAHGVTKINAAHQYGGPALTAQTVENNFGIASDKYVALDFDGFEKAIDMVGGVDLAVDKKMDYDDNWGHLHIHLRPGMQHLNGAQAMGFVRFRHSDSDLVRVQRQQTLIAALKTKLHRPQTLTRLPALLDMLDTHVASDLTTDQEIVLARFLHDTPRDKIFMTTLPSRPVGSAIATDWAQAAPLIRSMFGVAPAQSLTAEDVLGRRRHRRHRRLDRVAQIP